MRVLGKIAVAAAVAGGLVAVGSVANAAPAPQDGLSHFVPAPHDNLADWGIGGDYLANTFANHDGNVASWGVGGGYLANSLANPHRPETTGVANI